jgi:hypothetical protein
VNGFSVRDYLVENYSAIQFDDEVENELNLRILSDVEDNGIIENPTDLQAIFFERISPLYRPYLAAIKTKPFLILGGFSGTGKSQKVKELAFLTCPNDDEMNKKLGNTENTPGNSC